MLFLAIRKRMDEREEGFTLIELLVVVIIIGILAAIAIPAFLNQRERARRAAVQSDLRNTAIQAETFFTDNGTYDGMEAAGTIVADYIANSVSDGVTVTAAAANTNATDFCISGTHAGLPAGEVWSYDNDRAAQLDDVAC